jgi:glutamyl-tRNA synthetase
MAALPGLKQRAKTLTDLTESASYLWRQRPLDVDDKAAKILGENGARTILAELLRGSLMDCGWTEEKLEAAIQDYAKRKDLKLCRVAQPLRAALTGRGASRGIYDVLMDLGREESLARIKDQLAGIKLD